jgi:hypothetical protein
MDCSLSVRIFWTLPGLSSGELAPDRIAYKCIEGGFSSSPLFNHPKSVREFVNTTENNAGMSLNKITAMQDNLRSWDAKVTAASKYGFNCKITS